MLFRSATGSVVRMVSLLAFSAIFNVIGETGTELLISSKPVNPAGRPANISSTK
jgi:hypothetical protein